ncbi:hypothetical protein [Kitasatospora sp. GP30]|uniref:hypothetical protein n=1 Tax=Kitasatospora sp. GP30 TaxID=3035084 RepID=UPI00117F7354|nr:hypothetical protein [Kitasatospora sp. GP30]
MTTGVPLTASPLVSAGLPEAPLPDLPDLPDLPAADVEQFVALSVALTGFDSFELRGTGMAARYLHAVVEEVGEQAYRDFRAALEEVGLDPERLRGEADQDLARVIAHLWYLGVWPPLAAPACRSTGPRPTASTPRPRSPTTRRAPKSAPPPTSSTASTPACSGSSTAPSTASPSSSEQPSR